MKNLVRFYLIATLILGAQVLGCGRDHQGGAKGTGRALNAETQGDISPFNVDPEIQAEIDKLQGKWIGVSIHMDGWNHPVPEWYRYTFSGDRMTTETSDLGPTSVKFYLDPHTHPKQLDTSIMVDGVEEITKGIYSIEGDDLKFSWRVVGDRPIDYEPSSCDGKVVLVLRRARE